MFFNSFEYFAFLAVIVPVFFLTPTPWRWLPLLIGSYFFYMCWNPAYIGLILISTLVDYVAAQRMVAYSSNLAATDSSDTTSARPSVAGKRFWLGVSLFVNLGLLFTFKYYNFFAQSVVDACLAVGIHCELPRAGWMLPVGISFYTFQTLSYTIDVYRGRLQPERHLGKFALYVAFFPQLVAGPIERAANLLPQFNATQRFNADRLVSGLRLVLWGLFKKVVIADRLAVFVDRIYDDPSAYSGSTLLLATYFFAFQIYCDFSGYSDIAIGSARMMGFDLMQNFRLPYLATSIRDFWQRWHISLTTWFRDYVYVPLGGNRVGGGRLWARNILLVFVVSGIWHGAAWTFVIWGVLHATYYFVEYAWQHARRSGTHGSGQSSAGGDSLRLSVVGWAVRVLVTFHAVVLAWVFFRAATVKDAFAILAGMVTRWNGPLYLGPSNLEGVLSIAFVLLLIAIQLLQSRERLPFYGNQRPTPTVVRWVAYVGLICGIAMFGRSSSEFIYFQF
jgi:D-alanyl-lipoteichoic acid acyltransferase DltB (MBOAT superfamily)